MRDLTSNAAVCMLKKEEGTQDDDTMMMILCDMHLDCVRVSKTLDNKEYTVIVSKGCC